MTNPQAPGADELRVRSILKQRGVGPAGHPQPAVPPKPAARPRDWLDDILDADDAPTNVKPGRALEKKNAPEQEEPAAEPEEQPGGPRPFEAQPDYWPRPHMPAVVHRQRERAEAAVSPGTRRLLYNASAAGTGWILGLYQQFAGALADCGTRYSISGALVLGAGGIALIAHVWDRRTRHWWPGIAWAARIPLATAVLALALWAPAA